MFCINCGSDISENDRVCPNCGHIIGAPKNEFRGAVNENNIASLEKRAKAFLVDACICVAIYLLISIFIWKFAVYVWPFAVIAYFGLSVGGAKNATWGMFFKGIKVVKYKDGGKVTIPIAMLRAFLTVVFAFTFLFLIKDKEGRRLNDIITGTMVIDLT